jgi:hypothetical protein
MGFSHLSGLGLFSLKTGLQPPVKGTAETIKGIDTLHRLDYTGSAPYALIVADTINKRVFCFFCRLSVHDKSPLLWVVGFFLMGMSYLLLYDKSIINAKSCNFFI